METKYKFMTGNEACARGAMAAGLSFFAGYPITPATEIAEFCSEMLPRQGSTYMQMEDELGSIAAVIGASVTGEKAMTATSGPGFALMQEELSYAMMIEAPLVVVDVQRQGPNQGVATVPAQGDIMLTRWGVGGDHPVIVVAPASVPETFTETVRAFNLAEKYRTPVIVLSDATLAHMSEKVKIFNPDEIEVVNRAVPTCPPEEYVPFNIDSNEIQPMAAFGSGYRWFASGIVHDETGFPMNKPEVTQKVINHLVGKINDNIEDIQSWSEYRTEDADIIILAIGLVSRSAKFAIDEAREAGIKVGLFRPITLWPFPEKRFSELCSGAKAVITAEMNMGQLSEVAKQYFNSDKQHIAVQQSDGNVIKAEDILKAIKEVK